MFGAISAGFFFLLIGAIFITTPGLFERILDFFRDFDIVRVPNAGIWLPAPVSASTHQVVYRAVEQFSFAWAVFQIVVLGLRFALGSPWGKKAETAGNFVFWIGVGYLTRTWLIEAITPQTATTIWFQFWAGVIIILGLSLIVRGIILAAVPKRRLV